jgi:uncharacterized phage-associated protein
MSAQQRDEHIPDFMAPLVGFRSRKAAQICAYFALKNDGVIEKLKLIKLVYLSERRHLSDTQHPMLYDELFSLPHGPICSSTLNGIDGEIHGHMWDDYIARNGNEVVAMRKFSRNDFDEVADAELDTLAAIWNEFGHMTASQIRNWSHKHCQEYKEVGPNRRAPISYRDLLKAVGDPDAEAIDREISEARLEEGVLDL